MKLIDRHGALERANQLRPSHGSFAVVTCGH